MISDSDGRCPCLACDRDVCRTVHITAVGTPKTGEIIVESIIVCSIHTGLHGIAPPGIGNFCREFADWNRGAKE